MARPQQSHRLALWSTHPCGLDGTANTNLSIDLRHGSESSLPCLVLFGCFVIYNHRLPCHLWNQYKPDRFINIFVLEHLGTLMNFGLSWNFNPRWPLKRCWMQYLSVSNIRDPGVPVWISAIGMEPTGLYLARWACNLSNGVSVDLTHDYHDMFIQFLGMKTYAVCYISTCLLSVWLFALGGLDVATAPGHDRLLVGSCFPLESRLGTNFQYRLL